MQAQVAANLAQQVGKIRAHTPLPVAVGFGISNPEQARLVASSCGRRRRGQRRGESNCKPRQIAGLVAKVSEFVKSLAER